MQGQENSLAVYVKRLVELGLTDAANPLLGTDAGRLLGPYLDAYIEGRTDCKQRTVDNFKHAPTVAGRKVWRTQTAMAAITPADADRWRRWLYSKASTPRRPFRKTR